MRTFNWSWMNRDRCRTRCRRLKNSLRSAKWRCRSWNSTSNRSRSCRDNERLTEPFKRSGRVREGMMRKGGLIMSSRGMFTRLVCPLSNRTLICCQVRNCNWILLKINQMKSNKSQSTLCQSQKKENLNREHGTSVIRHQVPNSNIFSSQPYPLSSWPRDTRSNSLFQSLYMWFQSLKVEKAAAYSYLARFSKT